MAMEYIPFDTALCDAAYMEFNKGPKIEFQFPPKISSDNRKGDWKEPDIVAGESPAAFKKSGSREITLNLTYIVDGGKWTTDRIAYYTKVLRSYFFRNITANSELLIVWFKMWAFGGPQRMSCRFRSVGVKHSDTIVAHCTKENNNISATGDPQRLSPTASGPDHAGAFPLRTDIAIDMRIWVSGSDDAGKVVQNVTGLLGIYTPGWY